MDAFARRQADLRARRDRYEAAVARDGDVRRPVHAFVRPRQVDPDQQGPAAAVDDVLRLEPVEMPRRVLSFLQVQQFFRVDFRVAVRHGAVAVADRDQGKADAVKITLAVVGDVPAQAAVADLVVFMPFPAPFLRGKMTERGQIAVLPRAHGFHFPDGPVDLRTFHGILFSQPVFSGAVPAAVCRPVRMTPFRCFRVFMIA